MARADEANARDSEAIVIAELDRCRRRLTWQKLARRLVLVAAAGALVPLAVVVADHVWSRGLPHWMLLGSLLSWGALVVGSAVGLGVYTLVRRLNLLFTARALEQCSGIRHNSFINALLLRHAARGSYAAALRQAARDAREHPPGSPSPPGALRAPFLAVAAVVGLWVIYALVSPKSVTPSVARFLGAERAAPTATQIELLHPDDSEPVHAGEELLIEMAISGRPATEVSFDVRTVHYRMRPSATGPAGRWFLSLAAHEVTSDIHYRCSAGDAVVEGVIPVHPQPAISELAIDLSPPKYTVGRSRP